MYYLLQKTGPTESAVTLKENITKKNIIVPFKANFEEYDNIPDFDLLSDICYTDESKEENVTKPIWQVNSV